jgi:hypothetical protein
MNENYFYTHILKNDKLRGFVKIYKVNNIVPCSESLTYPSIRFKSLLENKVINPVFEKTMSLSKINLDIFEKQKEYIISKKIDSPVFFFCFNFNNYYHFLYDTLPYFISYRELKKNIPDLKLLVPNTDFKKFVLETFELLNIPTEDFIIVNENHTYGEMYYSDSMTHGVDSNLPPHISSKQIYEDLKKNSLNKSKNKIFPKKIYISRRTWENKDSSNIGTNYTNRRKMINEENLISFLKERDFTEVFCEDLSMSDKITMFYQSEFIIGSIGGGMSNCLFSEKTCKILTIVSPDFLSINYRFIFSLDNGNLKLFNETSHENKNFFKKYQRVFIKNKNIIGEVIDVGNDKLTIKYTNHLVSGWDEDGNYEETKVNFEDCDVLDNGLNSPYYINLDKFKKEF